MHRAPPPAVLLASAALVTLALLASAAARADDVVDLEVGPSDRVLGTLRPSADREGLFVSALRGSSVKATVRRKGTSELVPAVDLVDAALQTVATGTPAATGATLRAAALAATGGHRFRVTGDGSDGDYKLDLTVRPLRLWTSASPEDLGSGAETTFAFAAPAGATVSVDLRAARGSAFRAGILSVTGPTGVVTALDSDGTTPAVVLPRDRATFTTGPAGEHTLRIRNLGDAAGAWTISVRLKFTAARRATIDLRDDALTGEFGGTQAIFGRFAGGADPVTIDGGLNLDGVSITVPAGALTLPGIISMSEIDPFFVSDAQFGAGTSVSFQPAGTVFSTAAQVTVPIDLDAFDDPASELSIVVENSVTGEQETIAASSVDLVNATATFPVSHFSRFQPTSPNPRPLRGSFVDLELTGRTLPGYGAEFTFARNGAAVGAKQGLGSYRSGALSRTLRRMTIAWALDQNGDPQLVARYDEQAGINGTAESTTDGTVILRAPNGAGAVLERGRGGEALASVENVTGGLRLHAMLRKTKGAPGPGNLAGGWHGTLLEVAAAKTPAGRIAVSIAGHDFDLLVDAAGVATVAASRRTLLQQVFPDTAWKESKPWRVVRPGTLTADGADAVLRAAVGETKLLPNEVRLAPVLGGDALVGSIQASEGDLGGATAGAFRLVVLVRHSDAATAADLPANAILANFVAATESGNGGPSTLRFSASRGDLAFAPGAAATFAGVRQQIGHDEQGLATSGQSPVAVAGAASVAPDGSYGAGKDLPRGFLTPRRGTLFLFAPGKGAVSFGLALPSRPPASK